MRKITKEAETCTECGRPTTSFEWEDFCDNCGKQLDPWDQKFGYITTRVFPTEYCYDDVEKVDFCSWACFFAWLLSNKEKVSKAGHISMPTINPSNVEGFYQVIESGVEQSGSSQGS